MPGRGRFAFISPFVIAAFFSRSALALLPANLQCEHVAAPLGVDAARPVLSWTLQADHPADRGRIQAAYQILAASSPELLAQGKGDLWDSGKISTDQSLGITYGGKPLVSAERVYWKVRAWDQDGADAGWSPAATFTMGILASADWQAKWIGAADAKAGNDTLLLRHDFPVKPALARATLFVCGLGQYECTINGKKAGDDLLTPGWTNYKKTCLYDTYDITTLLHEGKNAAGLFLGNGMYNVQKGRYTKFTGSFGPLQAIAQLRLDYADGSVQIIGTDDAWRAAPGPITFSHEYGGEDFDARLIQPGWDHAGFADAAWKPAAVAAGPGGALKGLSFSAPPIRMFETLTPAKPNRINERVVVYDLLQNASVMPRISVSGPAGSEIRITPAELLRKDGTVDRASVGGGQAYWKYTLAGTGRETWFPKFFYQGCRYLQVEAVPAPNDPALPALTSIEGIVVHSAAPAIGTFECSNPLFNQIHSLIRWAQVSNMASVMTDCPHREKLGWLEEDHLNGPALRYEFDLTHFFHKTLNDIADSQTAAGLVPDIAPEYTVFPGGFRDSPEWGSALPLVAWQQYEMSGDATLLTGYFEPMKRYVDYLTTKSADHILAHGLGDWYDIGPKPPGVAQLTPIALTATAFYHADALIVARAARLLHRDAEAVVYEKLAADIKDAFNKKFYDPAAGSYSTGSQTANSIPLAMGLVAEADRSKVLDAVVADVRAKGLTAGDVGYRFLLRTLADGGRSDVIYEMNNQSTKPGYGYQLAHGATSLTEAWDARPAASQNHFMLGQIMEWFYHDLAGIAPDAPGFSRITINPAAPGDLVSARATYDSPHGMITSAWARDAKFLTLMVTIPANTSATVHVPVKEGTKPADITEGNTPAEKAAGVTLLRAEQSAVVFEVGSGTYTFRAPR